MSEGALMRIPDVFGWTGRRTLRTIFYVVDLTVFILQALVEWWRDRVHLFSRATLRPLFAQVIFTGVDALPAITILAFACGLSITSTLIPLAEALGTQEKAANLLADLVGMELSALITAIVIIGWSGSAIAVDLGNMKRAREVEGLELLGINVNVFFVTPRLFGASVAQLVLALYFCAIALFGAVSVNGLFVSRTYFQSLTPLAAAFTVPKLALFVIKNLVFGLIIAGTACFHALRVDVSPTEVPQQTQRAIVNSLILIFLLDGLLAVATR